MERNNIDAKLEFHKLLSKVLTKIGAPPMNSTNIRYRILGLFTNPANKTLLISEVSSLLVP